MLASDSHHNNPKGEAGEIQPHKPCRCFSFADMQLATNNFDDSVVVGVGGFGKVYKGLIHNDGGAITVAVKRLNTHSNQGAQEFWTEVKMLSQLRHPHLVALIGYCNESDEMILVYEYIPNGTLACHLYKSGTNRYGSGLSWERRLGICIDAARGLEFLHAQGFIHRDVKPTNILLNQNWVAKISDFGLSKGTTSLSMTHITTDVKGTFGYLDREYFLTHRLTKKSDVYAFGVVMLEVLCGRPSVNPRLGEEEISLVLWVQESIRKGRLDQVIDPYLKGQNNQISPLSLRYFVETSTKCLIDDPRERPTMTEVVASLELALASHQRRGITPENHHQAPPPPSNKKKGRVGLSWKKQLESSLLSSLESFRSGLSTNIGGLPPHVYPPNNTTTTSSRASRTNASHSGTNLV
ncbi:Non-specific serine/threonine protein kinase [Bertholletia excelsa]